MLKLTTRIGPRRSQPIDRAEKTSTTSLNHMRVEHRCRDVGVPQKLLHRSNFVSCLQHVRGEGMSQGMRRAWLDNSRALGRRHYSLLYAHIAQVKAGFAALSRSSRIAHARC